MAGIDPKDSGKDSVMEWLCGRILIRFKTGSLAVGEDGVVHVGEIAAKADIGPSSSFRGMKSSTSGTRISFNGSGLPLPFEARVWLASFSPFAPFAGPEWPSTLPFPTIIDSVFCGTGGGGRPIGPDSAGCSIFEFDASSCDASVSATEGSGGPECAGLAFGKSIVLIFRSQRGLLLGLPGVVRVHY